MRPPSRRRQRRRLSLARGARVTILHLGVILSTALLLRLAVAAPFSTPPDGMGAVVDQVTAPLTWPLRLIPALDEPLVGFATPADLLTLLLVGFMTLLIVGTIAGWEAEGRRSLDRGHRGHR